MFVPAGRQWLIRVMSGYGSKTAMFHFHESHLMPAEMSAIGGTAEIICSY
jgi:hypothetical protein